jgi:hypothetical protein
VNSSTHRAQRPREAVFPYVWQRPVSTVVPPTYSRSPVQSLGSRACNPQDYIEPSLGGVVVSPVLAFIP